MASCHDHRRSVASVVGGDYKRTAIHAGADQMTGAARVNDKLHGLEPAWITALGAAAAAAVGAFGLWLANRMLGKAAFQTAINAGFRGLLEEVNADRAALKIMLREAT